MCSAFPLDSNLDKKNATGLAFDDSSSATMFGNMTFEDAHPAYWGEYSFKLANIFYDLKRRLVFVRRKVMNIIHAMEAVEQLKLTKRQI